LLLKSFEDDNHSERTPFYLRVELGSSGEFFVTHDGKKQSIYKLPNEPLCLQSLPGGCWPVLVRISGDEVDLFWTFLLSATSHAWRLDQGFSRLLGRGVSRKELEELQHHFSSSSSGFLKWALTKASGERISLASLDDLESVREHSYF
jgi:hypothetical protein